MSLAQGLRSPARPALLGLALLGVFIVGFLDYITGYQVSLFVFYAIPILAAIWFLDRKCTVFIVLVSALMWWWTDRIAGHLYFANWVQIWETAVRLLFFVIIAIGGTAVKARRDNMVATVSSMRRLRELERDIVAASEREQHRIGADLHDGLCQYLAGITCVTASLRQDLSKFYPPLAGTATELHQLLEGAVVQARNIARGIAPVHMCDAGLYSALYELAFNTGKLYEIDCVFNSDGEIPVADHQAAMHFYRIAQEATSNAVRHGHATAISIHLAYKEGALALSVRDNGKGLPPSGTPPDGMGLRTMRYRAGLLSGSLEVTSLPEGGTCVECHAPLALAEEIPAANSALI